MKPIAYVSHQMGGRVRLRIPEKRNDAAYFQLCLTEIERALPLKAQTNPLTGSILLLGAEGENVPLAELGKLGVFELSRSKPKAADSAPLSSRLKREILGIDEKLKQDSGGAWDISSVAILSLLGLGTIQVLRGASLGPASSLFLHAFTLISDRSRGA
jgi:hypothetical protein